MGIGVVMLVLGSCRKEKKGGISDLQLPFSVFCCHLAEFQPLPFLINHRQALFHNARDYNFIGNQH